MTTPRRRMFPREHGAYAQLALPIVAAFGASRVTLPGVCVAAAACAAFGAHEPLLVLLGHRGMRARREAGPTARRWLGASATLAALGVLAAVALSPGLLFALAPPALFAAIAARFVAARAERTLVGELVAAAALASASIPVAIAGGLAAHDAAALWLVFCAAFAVSTIEVRGIAGSAPPPTARETTWLGAVLALILVAATRPWLASAAAPVVVVAAIVTARPPRPTALRRLGWTLAASSLVTALAAAAALRA